MKKIKKNLGFTLIEVLIACSIISVSMFALMQTAQKGIRLSDNALKKSQAILLMEEGAEAVKSIRDNNWTTISDLTLNVPYHIFFNTTSKTWVLDQNTTNLVGSIPTYPVDNLFDRTITITSVGRDSNDDIVDGGGTIDPGTKKVTVKVNWGDSNEENLSFYITDIFN